MARCGCSALVLPGVRWLTASAHGQRCISGSEDGEIRERIDQMLNCLHLRLNEQFLIDLQIWMIDSPALRATRASSCAGKKGPTGPADHALGRTLRRCEA